MALRNLCCQFDDKNRVFFPLKNKHFEVFVLNGLLIHQGFLNHVFGMPFIHGSSQTNVTVHLLTSLYSSTSSLSSSRSSFSSKRASFSLAISVSTSPISARSSLVTWSGTTNQMTVWLSYDAVWLIPVLGHISLLLFFLFYLSFFNFRFPDFLLIFLIQKQFFRDWCHHIKNPVHILFWNRQNI